MKTKNNQIIIDETIANKLRNLISLIDSEESKDDYEDIDTDAVLEYYSEIISTLRNTL